MNNEELDSQLSAMFDDELPEPQCELLARRLARDEGLKARWGRYAVIGACMRMERSGEAAKPAGTARTPARHTGTSSGLPPMRLNGGLAGRVSRAVATEPALLAGSGLKRSVRGLAHPSIGRWWQPVTGGAAVAAAVAAAAILWLRAGSPDAPIVAQNPIANPIAGATATSAPLPGPARIVQVAAPAAGEASSAARSGAAAQDSFVVPPAAPASSFAPPIELANFVVAHSEYSMPLLRRSALSALVAAEPLTDDAAENPGAADHGSRSTGGAMSRSNASHGDSSR